MDDLALTLAWIVGVTRALTGLWFLVDPTRPAEAWVGSRDLPVRYLVRAVGGRDLAMGAGLVAALVADRSALPWVLASIAGDATDAGSAAAMLAGRPRRNSLLFAVGFGLLGVVTAALLA